MREWLEGHVRFSPSDLPAEHEKVQGTYTVPAERAVRDVPSSCAWKGCTSGESCFKIDACLFVCLFASCEVLKAIRIQQS